MKKPDTHFESYLKHIINDIIFDKQIGEILRTFSKIHLSKNEYFVKEGSVCEYFCFIENGILQHSIDIIGEEKTTYLAMKNTCTSALKSFMYEGPSRKNIKAISECERWVVDLKTFKKLINENETFNRFYYNLIENQIYLIDDYRIDLLTLTPEERYKKLLLNDVKLLQQVPLHYLASFLGISNRHMSRIRKNIN